MPLVEYRLNSDIAVLTLANPPVNALSAALRRAISDELARANADPAVRAIIIVGGGDTFIAGADIAEFGTPAAIAAPLLPDLVLELEAGAKPVVAGIAGVALGGGLEVAMGCSARVAIASAKVGLPEVALGLLPGAGGTQRLTRLTGPETAIDLMTGGKHIGAADALRLGIVDAVVDGTDVLAGALAFARAALADGRTFTPVLARTDKVTGIDPALFAAVRATAAKKARGRIAPMKIIDCVEAACTMDAPAGLAFERARFAELLASDQREALVHYFFAEREARKVPGLAKDVAPMPVRKVGVIGSGTMGGGIAMVFANAGLPVTLVDINAEALAKGRATIEKNYGVSVQRGSMPPAKADAAAARIMGATDYAALADVDLVVEAVFETMELKKRVFADLDRATPPHAILATNTSSLDIDAIAAATSRPDKVVGTHFFSPANVMKLLENVRGSKSSPETLATVMALGRTLGKVVVLAGNTDGFIGNRMLQYYSAEAEYMLEEGATPEQVDRVAEAFGMPMGPFSMGDLAGIDVGVLVRRERAPKLPPGERVSPISDRLYEAGRLGQKTGKGYYRYEGRDKHPDPEVMAIIEASAREAGITRRSIDDAEIEDRLFMPIVNEGAKELEDGTAMRAGDIDVAWVNGYGFPAHKGGPMWWGMRTGLSRIAEVCTRLAERNGPRWAVSPLLTRLAREGGEWPT